jgi:serine/threonine-protein kinase
MGEVLLASDPVLGRSVALKRIRSELVRDSAVRRRFVQEANITAMLQHPAILPVYHFAEGAEEVFYTMRPVEGQSLAEVIRGLVSGDMKLCREWSVPHMVRLFLQAANAIAFAHSRGVIHGDLKPANIMVGRFEEVVILDWGVAAMMSESVLTSGATGHPIQDVHASGNGAVVGTLRYLAPELLAGERRSVRTDIFALGVIFYELLALRPPWEGRTVEELLRRREPPVSPISVQPFRDIPHGLAEVVHRALELAPGRRYATVEAFADDVAEATEGRGTWVHEPQTTQPWAWRRVGGEGRTSRLGDTTVLRSTGRRNSFQFLLEGPFAGNLRVTFEMNPAKGRHHLAVVLNAPESGDPGSGQGYCLTVLAGNSATLSLLRNGRDVAGAANPRVETGKWTRVVAERIDDRISLFLGDHEIYSYSDPVLLPGNHLALTGRSSSGVHIRDFRVASGGASTVVSCLAVPDAFFNRQFYDLAREEYLRIARSLARTVEGRVAALRACLSAVEAARVERDHDLRQVRLEECTSVLHELESRDQSCLFDLGRALLANERRQPVRERAFLERALTRNPEDPQRPVVQEWILTRLHGALAQDRVAVAQLAPLVVKRAADTAGGRRLILDVVRRVRRDWDMPPLMESRLQEAMEDSAARAEVMLFFGFWSARPLLIHDAILELLKNGLVEARHVADGLFALLAMDAADLAVKVLDASEEWLSGRCRVASSFVKACRASIVAVHGQVDEAVAIFNTLVPDPADRVYNGTRLRVAHACKAAGRASAALKILRPLTSKDHFACEHRAWLHLEEDEADEAMSDLAPLVQAGHHLRGRDMTNFLYCAVLVRHGRTSVARQIAGALPAVQWPRTWTLGSYHLSGRLGGGDIGRYRDEALPWERRQLARHLALLARCEGDEGACSSWSALAGQPLAETETIPEEGAGDH